MKLAVVGRTFMDFGVVAIQVGCFHSHVMSAGFTLPRDTIRHKLTAQALQMAVSTFSIGMYEGRLTNHQEERQSQEPPCAA